VKIAAFLASRRLGQVARETVQWREGKLKLAGLGGKLGARIGEREGNRPGESIGSLGVKIAAFLYAMAGGKTEIGGSGMEIGG
jgi:hypothetical protein